MTLKQILKLKNKKDVFTQVKNFGKDFGLRYNISV